MIRISVHVSSGTARFRVALQAESFEEALEIVARHNPSKVRGVTFRTDPEAFSVEDPAATVGQLAA